MYKKDFGPSGQFELGEKKIKDWLQFFDDPDPLYPYFESVQTKTLKQLVKEYDKLELDIKETDKSVLTKQDKSDRIQFLENCMEITADLIKVKLGLGVNFDYALDQIDYNLTLIERGFDKLAKYEDHRHRLIGGLYSEKPVY